MARKAKPAKPKMPAASDDSPAGDSKTNDSNSDNLTKSIGIPRVISLIVLVAVLLLIGVLFFRVMASFLVPLFLAAVLAVICNPLHDWVSRKMPGRRKFSALATTGIISLLVLAPLTWVGWKAYVETRQVVSTLADKENRDQIIQVVTDQVQGWEAWYQQKLGRSNDLEAGDQLAAKLVPDGEQEGEGNQFATESVSDGEQEPEGDRKKVVSQVAPFDFKAAIQDSLLGLSDNVVAFGLTGVKSLIAFAFGLGVMIFALYYFLADGPAMLEALMHLSPMDDDYERELLHQFATVSRAVVLATLITAVAQGLLAGIGYYLVQFLPMGAVEAGAAVEPILLPVFLLTMLTMLLSIVPFVGAMAVWVPVVVWVSFFVPGGFWPGMILAIYCFTIVSSADNVIKPYVLSGQSNLHPLLALLSVLGGVQLLGPIGILVGPMLVAFMQALLGMLRKELDDINGTEELPAVGS